jgi:hypothetical protein
MPRNGSLTGVGRGNDSAGLPQQLVRSGTDFLSQKEPFMVAQSATVRPREERSNASARALAPLSLVSVASEPHDSRTDGGRLNGCAAHPIREGLFTVRSCGVRCTRIAADLVGAAATIRQRRAQRLGHSPRIGESIVATCRHAEELPDDRSGIRRLLLEDLSSSVSAEDLAKMTAALRGADAVIAGPLSGGDENTPGLLPHLADLASGAYRALRPPRSLISHPGFAQLARRFHYIQMNHEEARSLGCGAIDIGVLAHRLRQIQGEAGEFAITSFRRHGLLWADQHIWEIEPIGTTVVDESRAASVFCAAWVMARHFQGDNVPRALASARAAAAKALRVPQ